MLSIEWYMYGVHYDSPAYVCVAIAKYSYVKISYTLALYVWKLIIQRIVLKILTKNLPKQISVTVCINY